MSIENAILELAAALRYSADMSAEATRANTAAYEKMAAAYVSMSADGGGPLVVEQPSAATQKQMDNELAHADKAVEAELQQAVTKVEADAKKNAGAADTATSTGAATAGSAAEPASSTDKALDYNDDVKPVLVKYAGKFGKAELVKLLGEYGAAKGDDLKGDSLAGIKAAAESKLEA